MRNRNPWVPQLVWRNELGLDDWLSSTPNSAAADLAPLVLRCMQPGEAERGECGGPLGDEAEAA